MSQADTAESEPEDDAPTQEIEGQLVAEEAAPFEAIIQADTLLDFMAPLDPLAQEFRLQLTDDGFRAALVDPGNVAMSVVDLDREAFESYRIDGDGGMIGLNIEKLQDILDFADADDIVHLALNAETMKLEVAFDTVEMSMACIDPSQVRHEPDIPHLELAVDVTLTGAQFKRSVDLAEMVSDQVMLVGDPSNSRWVVRAEGDIDDVEDTYQKGDLIHGQVPDDHDTTLGLGYLADMAKPIPKGAEVRLRHGTEFPVKFDYQIGEHVEVRCMQAPRIPVR